MAHALVIASIGWPLLLGLAGWQTAAGHPEGWTAGVYVAASVVCHQIPARSFHAAGAKWPVCARCSGLYLAAPVGAVAAWAGARRARASRRLRRSRMLGWLLLSAMPSLATWTAEFLGAVPVSNVARFVAALPLGAMVAVVLVRTVHGLD